MTVSNQSKAPMVAVSKRPYSGIDALRQRRDISDRSKIDGTSAMISEDRTDPFTESGNFDRDTQDEFVAQEFEKISFGGKKKQPSVQD